MLPYTRNLRRLFQIGKILARYDALFALEILGVPKSLLRVLHSILGKTREVRFGQRLVQAFLDLGPSFIKLGQAISTRPDLIGDEVA